MNKGSGLHTTPCAQHYFSVLSLERLGLILRCLPDPALSICLAPSCVAKCLRDSLCIRGVLIRHMVPCGRKKQIRCRGYHERRRPLLPVRPIGVRPIVGQVAF